MALTAGISTLNTLLWVIRNTIFSHWHPNLRFVVWITSWPWQTWVALWSVVWMFVVLQGAVAVARKRTSELEQAKRELASLKGGIRAEKAGLKAKFSFWLQVDKTRTAKRLAYLEPSALARVQVDFPCVNLVVWNEGQSPLKVLGFRLGKAGQLLVDVDHPLGVPPAAQAAMDATEALLQVLSGEKLDFSKMRGVNSVSAVLRYEEDSAHLESAPSVAYVKGDLRGTGSFNFQVARRPFQS